MLRHHMAVITRDSRLKREVQRVTAATGSTADFTTDAAGLSPERPANLAIFDARSGEPDRGLVERLPRDASFIWILEEQALLAKIDALKDSRVVSLMCHDARFDDDEFIASATKALRGNVFGLPKYFPWGVTTYTMVVKSYADKTRAIEMILHYAQLAGVRGPVRDRIQIVADELMMNALYHAPTDDQGNELYRDRTVRELAQLPEVQPIEIQYGSSGRYFGMSVRDGGGSLTRQRAVDYLKRAASGTASIEDKKTGAGLGLVTVLRSVSKLIFNLDPGRSTEVIGLFDLELFAKGKVGARSVHIFTSNEPPEELPGDLTETETPNLRPSWRGVWIAAAILLAVFAGLGGAFINRQMRVDDARAAVVSPAAEHGAEHGTVTVFAEPENATVTVDDQVVAAGSPVDVPGDRAITIHVAAPAHQAFMRRLEPAHLGGPLELHVALRPEPQARRDRPNR